MKKLFVLCVMVCGLVSFVQATNGCEQRLTKDEFRAKQQAFITDAAGLSSEEAAKFFPLYFELQDKKKVLNDKLWDLMRQGKNEDTSEAQYEEILEGIYDARIASERLEKTYFEKFKRLLSCKKIYLVQRAEMRFHRELLKDMRGKRAPKREKPQN